MKFILCTLFDTESQSAKKSLLALNILLSKLVCYSLLHKCHYLTGREALNLFV